MGSLKGIGIEFDETMKGWIAVGEDDPEEGRAVGKEKGSSLRFDLHIAIADLDQFISITEHEAALTGSVAVDALEGVFPISDGVFNLFSIDAETGKRQMVYTCRFEAEGNTYFVRGAKEIYDDPPPFDFLSDMTTLSVTIWKGPDGEGEVFAAGQVVFSLLDAPALVASIDVTGTTSFWKKIKARMAFLSFITGILRQEYLRKARFLYDTEYENLVLSGKLRSDFEGERDFAFVSGVHDKDFPWGDGELFWDVLLVVGDRRFCITDRVLDGLELDVDRGSYRYDGPIYELSSGFSCSFSEIQKGSSNLVEHHASIEIDFDAQAFKTSPLPFAVANDVVAELSDGLKNALRSMLPSEHTLGIHITPHTVSVTQGSLKLTRDDATSHWDVVRDETFGEAESSTFRNVKEPTLLYSYICSVDPSSKAARVQIHSNTIRDEPRDWIKDRINAVVGDLVSRVGSKEMLLEGGQITITDLNEPQAQRFEKVGIPLIEVNNDHYPTAVFQRRIIKVKDPLGAPCFALEEDMNTMRCEPLQSDSRVTVAAIRGEDKSVALDAVLEKTSFFEMLEERWAGSGKVKDAFSIIIKPNFMFAYNQADRSTYTDPELVEQLVDRLYSREFTNITVVEAQSTYGEYFTNRGVRDVAAVVGYDISGEGKYSVVDLTEDLHESEHLGASLGEHPVPTTWRGADFRISFAKNKTHAYAYYTLTLKNIYGALPLGNKFKEYHCDRDIYRTTMEYLEAFPVHYGLIDGYLSADGPFGIFADSDPNETKTIIGGADLVAVDWVGASKMGLDPMVSEYMKLAVEVFGKPAIDLVGDPNPYRPWLNVPVILSTVLHKGVDANHYFGNLMYMSGAYMDTTRFAFKNEDAFIEAAREALTPIKEAVFLKPGGERTAANKLLGRMLTWLGQ